MSGFFAFQSSKDKTFSVKNDEIMFAMKRNPRPSSFQVFLGSVNSFTGDKSVSHSVY